MNSLALALRQIRYENIAFWRNPVAAFFVFFFPLIFLVLFNLIFGNRKMELPGGVVSTSTFYVPAIVAMSVIYTCYSNVAIGMSFSREQGLLKCTRGTPLPGWSFLFGRIAHSLILAVILVVIVTAAGALVYDVDIPTNTLPAALLSLGGRGGGVLRPRTGDDRCHSQRRIISRDRERVRPSAPVHIGRVHPAPRRALMAHEGRRYLPGKTLRAGDAQVVRPVRDGDRARTCPSTRNGRMDSSRAAGRPSVLLLWEPRN